MKLFELCIGDLRRLVSAESAEEARRIGQDPTKHPDIHFMPFEVREFVLPGYVITVTPEADVQAREDAPPDDPEAPDEREALKAWLTERGIEFKKNWSTERLRELVEQAKAAESESDPDEPNEPEEPAEPGESEEPNAPSDPDALF
jgi:hypothetical protein